MLIQEEEVILKKMKDHSIHLMTHDGASGTKSKLEKKDKGKNPLKVHEGESVKKRSTFFVSKVVTLRRIAQKKKEIV